ncbi:hypothetical protein [Mesonia sp. HuA40]|uniref:hypothetical protein n=1 Tax=Mesonia sp. HuA40 TaxID=2602761 RepID=UPI0011C81BDF|nr:hypothetical protein [Mesonia sp. HuA40]TXK74538.1 hypothetical protein FT993_01850 [Mesonia sp. HuA40]
MSPYISDRQFTNYIHNNVAIPNIYNPLNWEQVNLNEDFAEQIDMQNGIDYVFRHNGQIKTVQERFRESKYRQYSDFTIRYRRDGNMHADRRESEYYKMQAQFFTYGITNCLKSNLPSCTSFLKYALIDLEKVYSKIDNGEIIIRDNNRNFCRIIENNGVRIIECPVKYNRDGSSSFFPIEISFLIELFGNDIVISQNGFI